MKLARARRAPRRITPVGRAERLTGYLVLTGLLAVAAYFLIVQAEFNPAVSVALREGLPGAKARAASSGSELAAFLDSLPGVAALSPAEVFGPDTLSDKIDGKAELYLSAGFKEMAWRAFAPTGAAKARFDVYVYEMASKDSAFAVFSGQRRGGFASVSLGDNAYAAQNALFFTTGPRYVEIVADSDAPDAVALLMPMGGDLAARIAPRAGSAGESGGSPGFKASAFFPGEGLTEGSLRLAKSDAFGLTGFSNVYTADYKLPDGEATGFAAAYPDGKTAETWRQTYLTFLQQNGYALVSAPEIAPGAPEGAAVLGLEGSIEVVMSRGNLLYGVHDGVSPQAALALAKALNAKARETLK